MATTIEQLHEDILEIKKELSLIKNILNEDFELTAEAKKSLGMARKTRPSKYISHESLKKKFLE